VLLGDEGIGGAGREADGGMTELHFGGNGWACGVYL